MLPEKPAILLNVTSGLHSPLMLAKPHQTMSIFLPCKVCWPDGGVIPILMVFFGAQTGMNLGYFHTQGAQFRKTVIKGCWLSG